MMNARCELIDQGLLLTMKSPFEGSHSTLTTQTTSLLDLLSECVHMDPQVFAIFAYTLRNL